MKYYNEKTTPASAHSPERGFSIIEILVALTIISIMSGTAIYYITAHKKLYNADDQALKIIDMLQEARQRSLTQRETLRVEIDLTANMVRLIDENGVGASSDDDLIRTTTLLDSTAVRLDARPSNINVNPPEAFPVPSAQFKQSVYPMSQNNQVCTIRFLSNGTIVDAGNNETGGGAVSVGVTLHVWSLADKDDEKYLVARAITVLGSTGSIRLWEYNPALEGNNKWQDSRRTSVYGGQQTGGSPTPTPTPTP